MTDVAIIADDLTGAMEAAAMFLPCADRIDVALGVSEARRAIEAPADGVAVIAVDTDSRSCDPREAATITAAAWDALREARIVVKKVDSLLRGNIASEITALFAMQPRLIVCTALPAAGRHVRGGVPLVDGVPLDQTALWGAESRMPPAGVAETLGTVPAASVTLDTVRSPDLRAHLQQIFERGEIAVCDAESDTDLDAIVDVARAMSDVVLVGSSAVCSALARRMPPANAQHARMQPVADLEGVLAIIGSAAPAVQEQLAALDPSSAQLRLHHVDDLLASEPPSEPPNAGERRRTIDQDRAYVFALSPASPTRIDRGEAVVDALVSHALRAIPHPAGLILSGGQTARAVLDLLDERVVRPIDQTGHGEVLSVSSTTGRVVATRPGSFGDRDSLSTLVDAVLSQVSTMSRSSSRQPIKERQ